MTKMARAVVCLIVVLMTATAFAAQQQGSRPLVIRNARIVPVSGPPIERGSVVIEDGRFTEIGERVSTPRGAYVINGSGLHLYPGMIELNTQVGIFGNTRIAVSQDHREAGTFNPHLTPVPGFNVESEHIGNTRMNGITQVLVTPSGSTIPGTATLFHLSGWTAIDMAAREHAALAIQWPGNQSGRDELRRFMNEAQSYRGATPPNRALAAMQPYLRGERPVFVRANSRGDIQAAMDFGSEYGLKLAILGGRSAPGLASELRERNVPVIYGSILTTPSGSSQPYDEPFTIPKQLHEAGVKFALTTTSTTDARNLPFEAAMAASFGLPEEVALRAVTLTPAEILGMDDEYGSIEVGKVANCVLATGSILDPRSQVREVVIRGNRADLASGHHEALFRKYLQRVDGGPPRN